MRPSPKTVAEVEAEMAKGKGKIERVKRSPDSGAKQPIETKGEICQVHKHSSMGCAVVSMQSASMREAIMNFAEQRFGRNAAGRVQMDIGDVKVQLKRHTDKQTKREVVTDIFVAWGHQQEKDSPLTVEDIAERFDQLYQEALKSPAAETPASQAPASAPLTAQLGQAHPLLGPGMRVPPPPPQIPGMPQVPPHAHAVPQAPHAHAPHAPPPGNPYYNAMCNMMSNPAVNPYLHQQFMAQQAAYAAYQQQLQQAAQHQQLMQMYGDPKGGKFGKGKAAGKDGKGKDGKEGKGKDPMAEGAPAYAAVPAAAAPAVPEQAPEVAPAPAEAPAAAAPAAAAESIDGAAPADPAAAAAAAASVPATVPDFTPAKPRLLQIVDPNSGKPIDTMGMNFVPRKPSTPLQITNPNTGEAVAIETKG
eukprot:s1708_g5.t1